MPKPKYSLSQQPRFPVVTIDTDGPISEEQIAGLLARGPGATVCVRSARGHANRGGYFFSVWKQDETAYLLETIEGTPAATFSLSGLVRFINHASGRRFDAEMLDYCQNVINFRGD